MLSHSRSSIGKIRLPMARVLILYHIPVRTNGQSLRSRDKTILKYIFSYVFSVLIKIFYSVVLSTVFWVVRVSPIHTSTRQLNLMRITRMRVLFF